MSESVTTIIERLEKLSQYEGPWTPLEDAAGTLGERVRELRERETRLDELLVVALVGGSGVGKSTLLNALAGDELARTSEFRPCTAIPTVYHPPGAKLDFSAQWHTVSGSALERLVVVDTPDSDTIVKEHRQIVIDVLAKCDLILICSDSEKYLDEATWSLLRPLRRERAMVCVETKAADTHDIREHWLARLREQGFSVSGYFRVNSRRTFDRKIAAKAPGEDEFDFPALEEFLHRELTSERVRRIKRSNAAGLLVKTVTDLDARLRRVEPRLHELASALDAGDTSIARDSFDIVSRRLFAEPHLWNYALGRETSMRAKGFVGALMRIVEVVRTLPARVSGAAFWPLRRGAGQRAADLLSRRHLLEEGLDLESIDLRQRYLARQSEIGVLFAKAGFRLQDDGEGYEEFRQELGRRIAEVLRGPARDRIVTRAQLITSWPATVAADAPPGAFVAVSGYNIVASYFSGEILSGAYFIHAGTVFGILLALEIFALSLTARGLAWSARRAAMRDLRTMLVSGRVSFPRERRLLLEARAILDETQRLRASVVESDQHEKPESGRLRRTVG